MKRYINGSQSSEYYPEYVLEAFRSSIGLDEDDDSQDDEIEAYSQNELFDIVCDYKGLIDYGSTIRNWILDIYDVDLE